MQPEKTEVVRTKRKYEKKKPKVLPSSAAPQQSGPSVFNAKDLNQYDFPSSDDETFPQVGTPTGRNDFRAGGLPRFDRPPPLSSPPLQVHSGSSEAEEENDPDGPFAFRRKAGCQYYAVGDPPPGPPGWPVWLCVFEKACEVWCLVFRTNG